MSEEQNAAAGAEEEEKGFGLQRVYLKDVSFEVPNAPMIFQEEWNPDTNVNLNSHFNKLTDEVYEVVISVTVTAKVDDKVAYLCEVQQAGIFQMRGFGREDRSALMGIHAPTILFPYLRETVSTLIGKGSFPQMLLKPVDFAGLYARKMEEKAAATAAD